MTAILQAVAATAIVLGTTSMTVVSMTRDIPDLAIPAGPWEQSHALDGRAFQTMQTSPETGDETNELRFADGAFQSARSIGYCNFGWTPYQTWTEGEVIHFTATTRCPDAPLTMVWHGSVTGDKLVVAATWTTRRWYWTQQIELRGAGEGLARGAGEISR
jgi:hypothetical protein